MAKTIDELMVEIADAVIRENKAKLSDFKKVKMTKGTIDQYKKDHPILIHVNPEWISIGWFDDDVLVAICSISGKHNDGYRWLAFLYVNPKYQKQGIGQKVLDYAIRHWRVTALGVRKTNTDAVHIYKKAGFKVKEENDKRYIMVL